MPKFNILNSQAGIAQILVLLLLLGGIGLGTYLVQQRTNIFPKAQENKSLLCPVCGSMYSSGAYECQDDDFRLCKAKCEAGRAENDDYNKCLSECHASPGMKPCMDKLKAEVKLCVGRESKLGKCHLGSSPSCDGVHKIGESWGEGCSSTIGYRVEKFCNSNLTITTGERSDPSCKSTSSNLCTKEDAGKTRTCIKDGKQGTQKLELSSCASGDQESNVCRVYNCNWSECAVPQAAAPGAQPAAPAQGGTQQTPPSDTTPAQCTKKTCAYSQENGKCYAGVCKDPKNCGFNKDCIPDPDRVCSNEEIDCTKAGSYGTINQSGSSETASSEGIKLPIPFGFINLGTPDRLDDLKSQSQTAFKNYQIYSQILAGLKEKGIDVTKAQSLIDQGQAQTNACIK